MGEIEGFDGMRGEKQRREADGWIKVASSHRPHAKNLPVLAGLRVWGQTAIEAR